MKNLNVCIIGLGYVGLPLAVAFAGKFKVLGYDINLNRIHELQNGNDKTNEIETAHLKLVKSKIFYTSDIQDAKQCNIYIVTVPTPIDSNNKPDLRPLIESTRMIGSVLSKGDIVIYESTVYPGVTEDICAIELENSSGLEFNKDFYCGYSPERINPGDKGHSVTKILKITSGSNDKVAKIVDDLYKQVITAGTYLVSSIKVAEAAKVIENTQRDVNIALVNELAIIFNHMNIDTNEVIEAASTKWNFIKLSPGLVGGHCIGVDPYYLTHKAEELGYIPNLILSSRKVNNGMAKYIADQTVKEMISSGNLIKKSKVLILGVTFKENCHDMRNTKVVDIITELKMFGVEVDVYDPWVNYSTDIEWYKHGVINDPLKNEKKYDAIIVAVAHDCFKEYTEVDYKNLSSSKNSVIIDVKGIVKNPTWRL